MKKVFKKRIFISRIAPGFTAQALYAAVKPKLQSSLSVIRLRTLHESYSSFCLLVNDVDEKTLLSAQFWADGTIIKPFFGRLLEEKIDSRYDGQGSIPVVNVTSPPINLEVRSESAQQGGLLMVSECGNNQQFGPNGSAEGGALLSPTGHSDPMEDAV